MKFRLPHRRPKEPWSLDDFITIDRIYGNFKEQQWDRCRVFIASRKKTGKL